MYVCWYINLNNNRNREINENNKLIYKKKLFLQIITLKGQNTQYCSVYMSYTYIYTYTRYYKHGKKTLNLIMMCKKCVPSNDLLMVY